MHITKVNIENFKCYKEKFSLELHDGVNIIVGNNEAGKSTILEAIHLALTGLLNGRYLKNELSQYLFNLQAEREYIESLKTESPLEPPRILIELFLSKEDDATAHLLGNGNSEKTDGCGISFCITFDEQYRAEYSELIKETEFKTIPIEYYKTTWESFARESVTARRIPMKSALIDSASIRGKNGSDTYVSRIIRENLEEKERVEISQAHRKMKESFMEAPSVQAINDKINTNTGITNKKITISVDLATQNAWEASLITYLDEIPFHYVGKGEQTIVKTGLALGHKKSREASILLLEEPESHLSHTKLNELIKQISEKHEEKQILIATHSSFVANKLGLNRLIFLNDLKNKRFDNLSSETKNLFKRLAGYDTLRLILCKKAILVEGPSDELIIQKAYMKENEGRLPIGDGIDVISVGTSFLRFLEIAEAINKSVSVVTDNDGNLESINRKYKKYLGDNEKENIKICFDELVDDGNMEKFNYNTLEPSLLRSNSLNDLNDIFDKKYKTDDELLNFMNDHKTDCALKIFETDKQVEFPQYILDAIKWVTS